MPTSNRRGHTRETKHGPVQVKPHTLHTRQAAATNRERSVYASRLQVAGELSIAGLLGVVAWSLARTVLSVTLALTVAMTVAALSFVGWVVTSKRRRHRVRLWRRKVYKRAKRKTRLGVAHTYKRLTGQRVMASTKRRGQVVRIAGLPESQREKIWRRRK